VVVRTLLGETSRARAQSLLLAQKRLARLAVRIEELGAETPVYVAPQGVMDAVAGFHIHRGILAHGVRPPDPGASALLTGLPARAIVLALFGVSNHDNVGAIFRNAAAFGADAVLLDGACCDPLYRKAIRVGVGAQLTLPFSRLRPDEDAATLLADAGFERLALTPSPAAAALTGRPRSNRVAILLGAEGLGLPEAIIRRATAVSIPMAPGWDSLNVATAGAVALYELTRNAG
jgi:tRNA G18 (ribose-2'-O)-methylase SpoU